MCKSDKRHVLPLTAAAIALAIGGAFATAHAAVDSPHQPAVSGPVTDRTLSPVQQKALAQENRRYETALAACKRLPQSERTTCASQAGLDGNVAATS